MYNEEIEMSVKMRNAGYKFVVTEKLEILHEWGSSSSDRPDKKEKLDFFIKNWLTSTICLYEEYSYYDSKLKKLIWKTLFLVKALEYSIYQANSSYLFFAFGLVKKFISNPTNLQIKFRWRIFLFFVNEFVELIRIVQRSVS
jgi:GT2 family glycosyltransferase